MKGLIEQGWWIVLTILIVLIAVVLVVMFLFIGPSDDGGLLSQMGKGIKGIFGLS